MGKPSKKVYEYQHNGKLCQVWDSQNDFRKHHYPKDIGSRPIFTRNELGLFYHITPLDTIALPERVNQPDVAFLYKVLKSKLCNFNKMTKQQPVIQMFNLKNELLAEFTSLAIVEHLIGDKYPLGTIYHHLKSRKGFNTYGLVKDYYFKYKTDQ